MNFSRVPLSPPGKRNDSNPRTTQARPEIFYQDENVVRIPANRSASFSGREGFSSFSGSSKLGFRALLRNVFSGSSFLGQRGSMKKNRESRTRKCIHRKSLFHQIIARLFDEHAQLAHPSSRENGAARRGGDRKFDIMEGEEEVGST